MALTSAPARVGQIRTQREAGRNSLLRKWDDAHRRHRAAAENAAATRDTFMDIVVLLSVLMFLALACGVGMLVLQSQVAWVK